MGTQQITAPPCARPAVSGLIHSNVRHTAGFTVVGNHEGIFGEETSADG
ncbi:hypothetical protein [Streptomyces sp. NPDC014623]